MGVVRLPATPADLARLIDHTLLKPEATPAQVEALCAEAVRHRFCSVCVNSAWVAHAAAFLRATGVPGGSERPVSAGGVGVPAGAGALSAGDERGVKVCAVVGFPLGAMASAAKAFEARTAIDAGATEIDMVINVGALKAGMLDYVAADIAAVRAACAAPVLLKVIIETALLTDEEKVAVSRIVAASGSDFIKTSTGFAAHGATVADVALLRREVGPTLGVKASGGVRTFADAVEMIRAGATRLGTSGGVAIVQGMAAHSGY